MNRLVLIAALAPVLPFCVFLVWWFGHHAHPHQVGFAFVLAIVFGVAMVASQIWIYRIRMRAARRL